MGSACICPFFILSDPFLNSFTPYSLNATCCDDCGCLARAFKFVPCAAANADGLAEVCDCHQVHYVHMWCLSSLWRRLSYSMLYITGRSCVKGLRSTIVPIHICRRNSVHRLLGKTVAYFHPFFSSFLFFLFSRPVTPLDSDTYWSKCEQSRA